MRFLWYISSIFIFCTTNTGITEFFNFFPIGYLPLFQFFLLLFSTYHDSSIIYDLIFTPYDSETCTIVFINVQRLPCLEHTLFTIFYFRTSFRFFQSGKYFPKRQDNNESNYYLYCCNRNNTR